MKGIFRWLWLLLTGLLAACSVMPATVRQEALPQIPYDVLLRKTVQYQGQTVIVGGYVLEVTNDADRTVLSVVQAPLDITHRPRKKDLSKGRLLVVAKGFLDPEVYTKDRMVTVAGKLTGSSQSEQSTLAYPYLRIDMETIHLWPVVEPLPPDVYWDPWWHPPYWRYHPFYYPYYPYRRFR